MDELDVEYVSGILESSEDPFGSYTGVVEDAPFAAPEQDADDL